ncbi:hypothetical protein F7725_028479 [Dissostichus mawsoni]|uniref:BHLH domain-containing protein n=2 Tax=Dissostichus mawsoni TaxID=36200 RepID=A0A7J5XG16_DISMA|nr:hypothetical protein F7725_028479 [Dissostichus mawsoni]
MHGRTKFDTMGMKTVPHPHASAPDVMGTGNSWSASESPSELKVMSTGSAASDAEDYVTRRRKICRLKTSLPWVPADTKLSKLDTLRLASSYISHLRQILQEDRLQSCGHPHRSSCADKHENICPLSIIVLQTT